MCVCVCVPLQLLQLSAEWMVSKQKKKCAFYPRCLSTLNHTEGVGGVQGVCLVEGTVSREGRLGQGINGVGVTR